MRLPRNEVLNGLVWPVALADRARRRNAQVDLSKIDFSEYEDVSEVPAGGDAAGGGGGGSRQDANLDDEFDDDGMAAEEQWKITHLEEVDVGKTFDVFPKVHGDGVVTKKLLTAGSEFDNPREGWAVELSYEARVVGGDGSPFEARGGEVFTLGKDAFPSGVTAGLHTMREGERALITVQPAKAFGAEGVPGKGIAPNSVVEYDMTCHRIIEVTRLDQGRVVKRVMVRAPPQNPPSCDTATAIHPGWNAYGALDCRCPFAALAHPRSAARAGKSPVSTTS